MPSSNAEKKTPAFAWWMLWIVVCELVFIGLVIPSATIDKVRLTELEGLSAGMGGDTSRWAYATGIDWYDAVFERTGIRAEVHKVLIPSEEQRRRSKGFENLGQGWFFPYLEARVYVMFSMLELAMVRAAAALAWSPFFAAVLVPAALHGMFDWKRRQYGFSYASPIMHGFGLRAVAAGPVVVLIIVIAPTALPVTLFPILAIIMAAGAVVVTRHTQKRV